MRNTERFDQQLAQLNNTVSDLKAQVQTERLRQALNATEQQLVATRAALHQPKPSLKPSFFTQSDDIAHPVTTTVLPLDGDSIPVEYTILNDSVVAGTDCQYNLVICDGCKFAAEPERARKLSGTPEQLRNFGLQTIAAKTKLEKQTVRIIPPPNVSSIQVGVRAFCANSGPSELQPMTIAVRRPLVNFSTATIKGPPASGLLPKGVQ